MLHTWTSFSGSLERCVIYHDSSAALERIEDLPVCLVHGSEDAFAPAERVQALATRYRTFESSVLDGADHNLFLTHTDFCLEAIRSHASRAFKLR